MITTRRVSANGLSFTVDEAGDGDTVILLVLDFGKLVHTALLANRPMATLANAAIVVALDLVLDRLASAATAGQNTLTAT